MTLVLGINGFGRVGRTLLRRVLSLEGTEQVEVVAVNDPADVDLLADLLTYDSPYGRLEHPVRVRGRTLCAGPHRISVTGGERVGDIDWRPSGADVVVETAETAIPTGTAPGADAAAHLASGARKVVVAAPSSSADATIAVGINDDGYDPGTHHVVSAASGVAHCVAPMLLVLHRAFDVSDAVLTTVHGPADVPSPTDRHGTDLRQARSAALGIVPSTMPATSETPRSLGALLAGLSGPADPAQVTGAVSVRVPVENGSLADLTALVPSPVTAGQVNRAFADASEGRLRTHLRYSEAPLVSGDVAGSSASCVFDAGLTTVCAGLVKVFGWYDSEWGFACRLLDLAEFVAPEGS